MNSNTTPRRSAAPLHYALIHSSSNSSHPMAEMLLSHLVLLGHKHKADSLGVF